MTEQTPGRSLPPVSSRFDGEESELSTSLRTKPLNRVTAAVDTILAGW